MKNASLSQAELVAKIQTLKINIDQQMISKIEKNIRIVTNYELVCFFKILDAYEKYLLN